MTEALAYAALLCVAGLCVWGMSRIDEGEDFS